MSNIFERILCPCPRSPQVVSELLSSGLWPNEGSHHCCSEPRSCTARILCGAGSMAMAGLLMRFGAGAHAGQALKLVACGKAPFIRNEEVVQVCKCGMYCLTRPHICDLKV